jgi:uncharacterized protein YodC (DUF2158 family)
MRVFGSHVLGNGCVFEEVIFMNIQASAEKPKIPTPKFSIGAVVQLKSGGPLMTVCCYPSIEPDGKFSHGVRWFNKKDDSCEALLMEECLNKAYTRNF